MDGKKTPEEAFVSLTDEKGVGTKRSLLEAVDALKRQGSHNIPKLDRQDTGTPTRTGGFDPDASIARWAAAHHDQTSSPARESKAVMPDGVKNTVLKFLTEMKDILEKGGFHYTLTSIDGQPGSYRLNFSLGSQKKSRVVMEFVISKHNLQQDLEKVRRYFSE